MWSGDKELAFEQLELSCKGRIKAAVDDSCMQMQTDVKNALLTLHL